MSGDDLSMSAETENQLETILPNEPQLGEPEQWQPSEVDEAEATRGIDHHPELEPPSAEDETTTVMAEATSGTDHHPELEPPSAEDEAMTVMAEPELWQPPEVDEAMDLAISDETTELSDEDEALPGEVEMSFFEHLEELRSRIFYSLLAVVAGALGCFTIVRQLVSLLEVPAKGVKFLQLTPGEYFFVSIKVAGYGGILVATPVILYQLIQFLLPGLTRRERRLVLPVVIGSSFLFVGGLAFAYYLLIPAALNFLVSYGADVVEQLWSIERYFEFVLVLLLATGLLFQVPILQVLLALLGIVTSRQMLSGWKSVVVGALVVGAIVTPSTDPITQSLLAGAVLALYFGGVGCVKLLGK
jgi:sec-independent protein translocase protein TatC